MELGIKNKIALVTGSSRGIGKSCALSLAKEGVKVVISGRDKNTLNNIFIASWHNICRKQTIQRRYSKIGRSNFQRIFKLVL